MAQLWRSAAAFTILVCAGTESNADTDREMATCAAIQSSVERLACFDSLAKKRDVADPKVDVVTNGDWQVKTETSKIDDTTNVMMLLESANSFQSRMSGSQNATLYIACREGSTDFAIHMGGEFLSSTGGFGEVTYRIDKDKAKKVSFVESTDNKALGLWQGRGIKFIKEIMSAGTLLLQVTPFRESAITLEFNVAGLAEAVKPLRQACKW